MSRWWLGLLLCTGTAQGAIHAALDSQGRLIIGDASLPGAVRFDPLKKGRTAGRQTREPRWRVPTTAVAAPPALQVLIAHTASEAGIDVALLHAVALHESGFNLMAVSKAGAAGLMQLMPHTARRFGVQDRFDPAQSLLGGARYLAWLLDRYGQDVALALAAYNAGEGAVRRHGNRIPPFPETQHYVRAVLRTYAQSRRTGSADICNCTDIANDGCRRQLPH